MPMRASAKDGAKNRLREQDIKRIADVWEEGSNNPDYVCPHYARFVTYDEIEKNDYNLNLPRYIEAEDKEIRQDIEAHPHGGLPAHDIEQMEEYRLPHTEGCPQATARAIMT